MHTQAKAEISFASPVQRPWAFALLLWKTLEGCGDSAKNKVGHARLKSAHPEFGSQRTNMCCLACNAVYQHFHCLLSQWQDVSSKSLQTPLLAVWNSTIMGKCNGTLAFNWSLVKMLKREGSGASRLCCFQLSPIWWRLMLTPHFLLFCQVLF